jgi:hypothetical protein
MRCYLMRGGHIAAVEILDVKSDEEAVGKCAALFEERKSKFEGFEVWDRTRKIAEGPLPEEDGHARQGRALRLRQSQDHDALALAPTAERCQLVKGLAVD